MSSVMMPRFIRYRDAPAYLGMDRNRFDREVRPGIVEIPLGERGIAFDRVDLDAWADDYRERNGRPGKGGTTIWGGKQRPGSRRSAASGTSTSGSGATADFAKALAKVKGGGRSST